MNVEADLFSSAVEIMSTPVVTVTPDTTIQQAVVLLEKGRISGLPVVDQDDHLLGMLTEFDLLRAIRNLALQGLVGDFMSTDIVTVDESASLTYLTDLMLEKRIRRVPVLSEGRVVGVVSRRDLVFVGNVRQQLLADLPVASLSRD
jgi:CBS domain-containing protein